MDEIQTKHITLIFSRITMRSSTHFQVSGSGKTFSKKFKKWVELRIDTALSSLFLSLDNAQPGNPMRILIVDDQPKVRAMLRAFLADSEIAFDEATNGREAVEHYASAPSDLVLMDVRMPVMDGIAATEKILSTDRHAHVVAVTDYDDEDCRREALHAGCRRLFGKGDLMSLRTYVKELLRSGHSGSMN